MEWKLFDGPVAEVSTARYHKHRDRADHLADPLHRPRMEKAVEFIGEAVKDVLTTLKNGAHVQVADLGCGDGGLLSLIQEQEWSGDVHARGYDFAPANVKAAHDDRGIGFSGFSVHHLNLFPTGAFAVHPYLFNHPIDIAVMTEVIEHLSRPHEVLRLLAPNVKWLVASSPWNENDRNYADCHAWAWDMQGYVKLLQDAGFTITLMEGVTLSTVVLARGKADCTCPTYETLTKDNPGTLGQLSKRYSTLEEMAMPTDSPICHVHGH